MPKKKPVRVFLIDRNCLFVEAFLFLCEKEEKISVVGFSLNGKGVLAKLRKVRPNVILVDAELLSSGDCNWVRTVAAELGAKVVLLSFHDVPEFAENACQNEVSTVLLKGTPGRRILEIICQLADA